MTSSAKRFLPAGRQHQGGLTLVETMATLAVAAVLLTAAVPPMQDFITRNRMSTEVNNFVASMYLARSEAVKRLQDVMICAGDETTGCSGSTDWESGWIVFADIDNSNSYTTGDPVLQQNTALPNRFRIIGGSHTMATFKPTGQTAGSNGTFKFCDTGDIAKTRKVVLSNEGRVRIEQLSTTGCSS